jgi:uncharacterized protein with GYD domain
MSIFKIRNPEDLQIAAKKRAEQPESGIKAISKSYAIIGQMKGFQILEVEDEKELAKLALYYLPEVRFKFLPLLEVDEINKLMS